MEKLKVAAVDDEPLALQNLESYILRTPGLDLAGKFLSSVQAFEWISSNPVDLVFMDIQMPDLTGIQLSRLIQGKTKVIFTTAYSEFALEGYKVRAIDYLLKPFGYEEFLESVSKARDQIFPVKPPAESEKHPENEIWFVKAEGRLIPVNLESVLFLEADGDYVSYHLESGKKLLVHGTLKELESKLSPGKFLRVHRSFLIQISKITSVDRNRVFVGNQYFSVGDAYRESFDLFMKSRML